MLEMGEWRVPEVFLCPLDNPTPGSNTRKLSPRPPFRGRTWDPPLPPPAPALLETPPQGSLCPRDGGSFLSRFQRRKKKTFYIHG